MKINSLTLNSLCVIISTFGAFCCIVLANDTNEGHGIQIITTSDHFFDLNLNELNEIFTRDDMKDRSLVVVSIAGPFRQGKSFLHNFFIRYLNAQYKRHDVSNWLERGGRIDGFKWRSGRKRETTGIWVWSDVFTHDYENGEKVAILLVDTQGVFDHQSSLAENTMIFALSMMMSSVQCYNLMHNIQEDDLQNLRLFSEYGRMAHTAISDQKPFQNLLFILRDWPHSFETGYGWNGTQTINQILGDIDGQTEENIILRNRLKLSFQKIDAFLMPSPGAIVAQNRNFTGNLGQIDVDFKTYVKILTESLFAPDKLVVKRIGGQKLRARDWSQYLQSFLKIFKDGKIPEPKNILDATIEASNTRIHYDILEVYTNSMNEVFGKMKGILSDNDLFTQHQKIKAESMKRFYEAVKFDDGQSSLQKQIEDNIERKFIYYQRENSLRHASHNENATAHNELLIKQIEHKLREDFEKDLISNPDVAGFIQKFYLAKLNALSEFDEKCIGAFEQTTKFRNTLERRLDDLKITFDNQIAQTKDQALLDNDDKGSNKNPILKIKLIFDVITLMLTSLACSTFGTIGMTVCQNGINNMQ